MAVEIKICGMTNLEDIEVALGCGADYVGFVLFPDSPRGITPVRMAQLLDRVPRECRAVGVFVNSPRPVVEQVAVDCRLHAVQLHGDEPAEPFADMPLPVWRAVRRGDDAWHPRVGQWPALRYVVDATVPGLYGGSGAVADWEQAARLARSVSVMLAGGLSPDNVADAIRRVRPLGVDVASGVEATPGRKDPDRLRRFVAAARAAGSGTPEPCDD